VTAVTVVTQGVFAQPDRGSPPLGAGKGDASPRRVTAITESGSSSQLQMGYEAGRSFRPEKIPGPSTTPHKPPPAAGPGSNSRWDPSRRRFWASPPLGVGGGLAATEIEG